MGFHLAGIDAACGHINVTGVANACGIHIHVGTNCSDASTIGGHFWNPMTSKIDPWAPVMYAAGLSDHAASFADEYPDAEEMEFSENERQYTEDEMQLLL